MKYQIILNEEKLDQFIDWLPDLGPSEMFYFQLFGRKKYLDKGELQSGHQSLSRFVCSKHRIKEKIRQLEVPLGTYLNREVELPQECLALYVTPNPRCHEKAARQLLKVLADKITKQYEGYNTYQLAMTELHKACGKKYFIDFDFDNIDFDEISGKLFEAVNKDAVKVLKTRGGFHVLVRIDRVAPEYSKTWYNKITGLGCDVKGDNLIPLPGCTQGGFCPHFFEI